MFLKLNFMSQMEIFTYTYLLLSWFAVFGWVWSCDCLKKKMNYVFFVHVVRTNWVNQIPVVRLYQKSLQQVHRLGSTKQSESKWNAACGVDSVSSLSATFCVFWLEFVTYIQTGSGRLPFSRELKQDCRLLWRSIYSNSFTNSAK